jgi:dolichol-phosphate mannosyltransferase
MSLPEVSIVLPMFNEAEIAERSVAEVIELMSGTGRSFEIVCVDDGSTDDTPTILGAMSAVDSRLVPVRFSRNFGKEAALAAGLEVARGRAVVILDADLQHPPGLIPEMLRRWDEGFEVVDAVKASRGEESWLYRGAARVFNKLMGGALGGDLSGASDFKLLDRQVVDTLLDCPERNRFFRGLVAWAGFRVAQVRFEVAERAAGRSKMGTFSLIAYSLRNLVAFSAAPLRVVSWIGFITVLAGAILALQTLYVYLSGSAVSGFTTVILLIYWLCGLILASVGVVGFYLSHMYEEQKARPIFVIRKPQPSAEVPKSADTE